MKSFHCKEALMIELVTFETAHLFGDAIAAQARFRYEQFVARDGWKVPTWKGFEYDQFDNFCATYLIYRDEDARVRGMVRLLPTTHPYMLNTLWPFLAPDSGMPSSPNIYENTRFAVDKRLKPSLRRRVRNELILASLEFGLLNDVISFILVSPLWVLNGSLSRAGLQPHILTTTDRLGASTVGVASVCVSSAVLGRCRSLLGVTASVLQTLESAGRLAA